MMMLFMAAKIKLCFGGYKYVFAITEKKEFFKERNCLRHEQTQIINWSIEECDVEAKLILFIKISKHDVVGAAAIF